MPDGSFINALVAQTVTPRTEAGRLFAPAGWIEVKPAEVAPLVVGTLTGFVDYLTANVDTLEPTKLLVHVADPSTVWLRSSMGLEADRYYRPVYLKASTELVGPCPLRFGEFMPAEEFIIALMHGFDPGEGGETEQERQRLLALVASIKENDVTETTDDGVSQAVKTSRGLSLVAVTTIKNPFRLTPYRTFRELVQPASDFILRTRKAPNGDRPLCALFEAEGGQWKLDAVLRIREYLVAKLPDVKVIA